MSRYTNANRTKNPDLYAAIYEDVESAEGGDREGLLTVQAFDSGDFPVMAALDLNAWEDGDLVKDAETGEVLTFVVRIQRRKPEQAAKPRRNYGSGKASESYPS